uniref:MARVEL domain-containing protein n=1 Tax=Xiphophorus couchianus TaxID=32473 RepID=A0A3B5L4J4_9TELE
MILFLFLQVFSIVVFSCIVNEGYINIGSERLLCVFNKNAHACNYGMTVGVACFLGSTCFLILDVYFPSMSNLKDRKRAVLFDLIFSGVASFLWFVGFCFLANQWKATSPDELPLAQGSDAARAIITFCFFSILKWPQKKQTKKIKTPHSKIEEAGPYGPYKYRTNSAKRLLYPLKFDRLRLWYKHSAVIVMFRVFLCIYLLFSVYLSLLVVLSSP